MTARGARPRVSPWKLGGLSLRALGRRVYEELGADEIPDRAAALSYYWLFALFRLVPPEAQGSLRRFVVRAWREGLYNPRWSRGLGRKRLLALLLTGR